MGDKISQKAGIYLVGDVITGGIKIGGGAVNKFSTSGNIGVVLLGIAAVIVAYSL